MKALTFVTAASVALLFIGCPARSIFPLFADKDVQYNPALVGTWVDKEDGDTFTFQKSGEKSYSVTIVEKKGSTETYKVQLGQIGKSWFFDSTPAKGAKDHHLLPAHIFSKMELNGDQLSIAILESDWLRDMIAVKKLDIAHVQQDGDIILTATTAELQAFALQYADNNEAFPVAATLTRTK